MAGVKYIYAKWHAAHLAGGIPTQQQIDAEMARFDAPGESTDGFLDGTEAGSPLSRFATAAATADPAQRAAFLEEVAAADQGQAPWKAPPL